MKHEWSMIDVNGRVVRSGMLSRKADLPEAKAGERRVDGVVLDGAEFWVSSDGPTVRPEVAVPDRVETLIGRDVEFTTIPRGTKIERDGIVVGEVGGGLTVIADEEKAVRLKMKPPFPYRPKTVTVIVDTMTSDERKAARLASRKAAARQGLQGLE